MALSGPCPGFAQALSGSVPLVRVVAPFITALSQPYPLLGHDAFPFSTALSGGMLSCGYACNSVAALDIILEFSHGIYIYIYSFVFAHVALGIRNYCFLTCFVCMPCPIQTLPQTLEFKELTPPKSSETVWGLCWHILVSFFRPTWSDAYSYVSTTPSLILPTRRLWHVLLSASSSAGCQSHGPQCHYQRWLVCQT